MVSSENTWDPYVLLAATCMTSQLTTQSWENQHVAQVHITGPTNTSGNGETKLQTYFTYMRVLAFLGPIVFAGIRWWNEARSVFLLLVRGYKEEMRSVAKMDGSCKPAIRVSFENLTVGLTGLTESISYYCLLIGCTMCVLFIRFWSLHDIPHMYLYIWKPLVA